MISFFSTTVNLKQYSKLLFYVKVKETIFIFFSGTLFILYCKTTYIGNLHKEIIPIKLNVILLSWTLYDIRS